MAYESSPAGYLERIHQDVVGNAGIVMPEFVADESRQLPMLYSDEEREKFQKYYDYLAKDSDYFGERYEEYIDLYDKRLDGRLKSAQANLIWHMSVVAIGQTVRSFDGYPLHGGVVEDLREISLLSQTEENRSKFNAALTTLTRENFVKSMLDPALPRSNGEGARRYALAPAAGGRGKKRPKETQAKQKKTSGAVVLKPGL